ncbi:MAG: hypothetical protein H6779_04020 [Candidatus Nomurabacteria bacterium]|nr:MAG: hypothetical protein H6779_04020 [Candidatus Nomurabacteria bacterium]
MSSALKNILILLVILSFAFVGYYMFEQSNDLELNTNSNKFVTAEMLANTELFIERSAILSRVIIDTTIFDDPNFNSYIDFSRDVAPQLSRNSNPFAKAEKTVGSGGF